MEKAMRRLVAKPLVIAASAGLFFAMPLPAQAEEDPPLPAQPAKSQDQVPGLQQTPDGQTLKTAGEKTKRIQETQAGPATSTGTGPTFPDAPPVK
jgi:hypothetical protein